MTTIDGRRSAVQIVEEQVREWSQRDTRRLGPHRKRWPLITVSREVGAGGGELGARLRDRLGFTLWDREVVQAIADESGADEKMMASLDEQRRKAVEDAMLGAVMGTRHTNVQYLRSLQRVVRTIAEHGSGIVIGRGANYICSPNAALKVRLVCPLEQRVSRLTEKTGMSRRDALALIERTEKKRTDFIRHNFHHDVADSVHYDLVLNSGVFELEKLVDMILSAYTVKFGRRPPSRT